jgi:hypothetical protein
MGIARLGVNAAVGAKLVVDTALLFEVGLLVGGGIVNIRKLADSAGLVVVVVAINNFSWPASWYKITIG